MVASEAAVGFWNHTGLLTSWQACPKTEVYREKVDEGILSHSIFTEVVLSLNDIMQDKKEKINAEHGGPVQFRPGPNAAPLMCRTKLNKVRL